jgi:hypothetical protein
MRRMAPQKTQPQRHGLRRTRHAGPMRFAEHIDLPCHHTQTAKIGVARNRLMKAGPVTVDAVP